jgi:hypothetical protein
MKSLLFFFKNLYAKSRNSGVDEFNNFITGDRYSDGIVVYTERIYEEITGEIAKHRLILQKKLYESFAKDESMNRRVKRLIDELAIEERELTAFDELRMIGMEAVPYIILHMDDYRELSIKHAEVEIIYPDTWESIAYYGPELVIDMLGIILGRPTMNNFGHTWSDGTNEERQRMLDGWRIYLYYLNNSKAIQ